MAGTFSTFSDSLAIYMLSLTLDFNYTDPHPNFDRSKVKGLVAQLFTLNKDQLEAATALEICAGGRLYNVVVDSAEVGTQLLQIVLSMADFILDEDRSSWRPVRRNYFLKPDCGLSI